jgi:hypothetical protein
MAPAAALVRLRVPDSSKVKLSRSVSSDNKSGPGWAGSVRALALSFLIFSVCSLAFGVVFGFPGLS